MEESGVYNEISIWMAFLIVAGVVLTGMAFVQILAWRPRGWDVARWLRPSRSDRGRSGRDATAGTVAGLVALL